MKIQRIAVGLEYEGSHFRGWQKQATVSSIQEVVQNALTRIAGHSVSVVAAGRTDAGVHATAQVIHFDTSVERSERAWVWGTNTLLPSPVRFLWAREVPLSFDARHSALQRHYRYLIYNHPIRPGLLRGLVGWYYKKLDHEKMQLAAQDWLGKQDFSSFRAAECQSRSAIREVTAIQLEREGDLIIMGISANAFLHHMVRNMVGALMKIGAGEKPVSWAKELLLAKDRRLAGVTALPNGLYLVAVDYPLPFKLPQSSGLGPWLCKRGGSTVRCEEDRLI